MSSGTYYVVAGYTMGSTLTHARSTAKATCNDDGAADDVENDNDVVVEKYWSRAHEWKKSEKYKYISVCCGLRKKYHIRVHCVRFLCTHTVHTIIKPNPKITF